MFCSCSPNRTATGRKPEQTYDIIMQEEGIPSNKCFSGSGWGVHLTHWKMMLWKFYPPLTQPFFSDFNSSLDRLQKLLPGFCFPLSLAGNIKHRDVWYPPLWCHMRKQARLSLSAFHTASDGTLEVWGPCAVNVLFTVCQRPHSDCVIYHSTKLMCV